ncbi:MAG: type I-D CRISPR-associated protein Cas7/Csc2 [Nitrososphaerota archaeon]
MYELLGRDSFAGDGTSEIPTLARDEARRIVIYVSRETVAPFINRSETPDETVTLMLDDGTEIIEVPARKFKSKEKLLGIRLCKLYNAIDPDYEYNDIKKPEYLKNPVSVLFGDTVVESGKGNQAMFPSRVLYSSSYSIRSKITLTKKLTHNALSSLGTMWDRSNGTFRQSLFNTEYVIPGTVFPSFVVLKDPTPEILYLVLRTLRETSYGAQTSITGPNFSNKVFAILATKVEPPVTSFTVSVALRKELNLGNENVDSSITTQQLSDKAKSYVVNEFEAHTRNFGGKLLHGETLEPLLKNINSLTGDEVENIFSILKRDAEALWEFSGFEKKKRSDSGRKEKMSS